MTRQELIEKGWFFVTKVQGYKELWLNPNQIPILIIFRPKDQVLLMFVPVLTDISE